PLEVPTSFPPHQGYNPGFRKPHIWTSAVHPVQDAPNHLTGLEPVAPENADFFTAREKDFEDRVYRALYGDELVQILSGATLADLDRQGKLFEFLDGHKYQGASLTTRLGGWLKQGAVFHGKEVACYHKEWDYFSKEFGLPRFDYSAPKPGVPPTPGHVLA